jgi:hypothetical protein
LGKYRVKEQNMDEENFFWREPLNVDAVVSNDGAEFLANADADAQGGENFYGQNQSLAGDGDWWDSNYPGQTTTSANSPTQDAYGLTILDAAQTAQLTSRINPAFINGLAPTVNTGAGDAIAAANQQTAASAARLNAQSPNIYLANIDQAAVEISRGQDGIATATQNIQTAQQNIATGESIIAQTCHSGFDHG